MSYGTCWAWSDGAGDFGLVLGQRIKFPSVSHYIVAKPDVVLGLAHEKRLKAVRESADVGDDGLVNQAKRVCNRSLEDGGELTESKGMFKYIIDLEGVKHPTRNKTDLALREKELRFCFRALDAERWEFAMGSDFLLQTEEYRCMVAEQGRTRSDQRNSAFEACGLLDRVQGLKITKCHIALKMFLTGNCFVEGTLPTISLECFVTGDAISGEETVCSAQNRPLIAALRNLQVSLQVFLSGEFAGAIDPFILALEGEKRPLELVPADFLKYSVIVVLRKFFRVVRSERTTAANGNIARRNPTECSAYLAMLFEKASEDLADHPVRAIDEAYFRMRKALEETGIPAKPNHLADKKAHTAPPASLTPQKNPRNPCAGYLGGTLKASKPDGQLYRCGLGKDCGFKHIGGNGKSTEEILDIISSMPRSFHDDLTKAAKAAGKSAKPMRRNGK